MSAEKLTYGQKLIAEAIDAHFGERVEDHHEDAEDTTNRDVWEAFDAISASQEEIARLRKANEKLHRRVQQAEAMNQSVEGILEAWVRVTDDRANRTFENALFVIALGEIMSQRKKIAARALLPTHPHEGDSA